MIGESQNNQIEIINAGQGILYLSDFVWTADSSSTFVLLNPELESQPIGGEIVNLQFESTPPDYGQYEGGFLFETNDEEKKEIEISIVGEGGDGPQPDILLIKIC